MIDWIKTAQGVVAIVAAILSTLVAWWCLGLLRLVFSPEQTSNTQPIDLHSAALGIVRGVADPFNGHIDEFRVSHVQRFRRLDRDHLEQHERPRRGKGGGPGRRRAATARGAPVSSSA